GNINSDTIRENIRINNWQNYVEGIYEKGNIFILWGSGLGTSNSSSAEQTEIIKRVENSFVTYLGETGLIGLTMFLILLIRVIYILFKQSKTQVIESRILIQILLVLIKSK